MNKHTPGPWTRDDGPYAHMSAIYAGDTCIALISATRDNPNGVGNRNLIAAAPDLLAALGRARPYVIAALRYIGDDRATKYNGDIKAIDAAIAKARGES